MYCRNRKYTAPHLKFLVKEYPRGPHSRAMITIRSTGEPRRRSRRSRRGAESGADVRVPQVCGSASTGCHLCQHVLISAPSSGARADWPAARLNGSRLPIRVQSRAVPRRTRASRILRVLRRALSDSSRACQCQRQCTQCGRVSTYKCTSSQRENEYIEEIQVTR